METNSSRCSRSEKVSWLKWVRGVFTPIARRGTAVANNSLGLEVLCLEDQNVFALLKACRSGRLTLVGMWRGILFDKYYCR